MKNTKRNVFLLVIAIIAINIAFYFKLYEKQIDYMVSLLNHQVQLVGSYIDDANNNFLSDLNKVGFMEDLSYFFTDEEKQNVAIENIKSFYSNYDSFISGIKIFDTCKNEFSLRKDDDSGKWLEQQFILHAQGEIYNMEKMEYENNRYVYYLPILSGDETTANVAVTIDYTKYFNSLFNAFNIEEYQWQWVINESGDVFYSNNDSSVEYGDVDKIVKAIEDGSIGYFVHDCIINGKDQKTISSFYSTQLLQKELAIVFSSPVSNFQQYLVKRSILTTLMTLLLLAAIIWLFLKSDKEKRGEISRLKENGDTLVKLIDAVPVGLVLYDKQRNIIKANDKAANFYSWDDSKSMVGQYYPAFSMDSSPEYLSNNLGTIVSPDQLVIVKKENEDRFLFKNSISFSYNGKDVTMDILDDITAIERAREKEETANLSKTDILSRISYELRGPYNGIVGMVDLLDMDNLPAEQKNIVSMLRQSMQHFTNTLNIILDFTKMENGMMALDAVPFSLKNEVEYCKNLVRIFTDKSKNVTQVFNIDDNLPESIVADPFRLRQVLTLLLDQSINNVTEGIINFSAKVVEKKEGIVTLRFDIQDTGKSFTKQELDMMFDETKAMDFRSVDKASGSVFGNILAKQIISKMGGTFEVESPSGLDGDKGLRTSFTFTACSNDRIEKKLGDKQISSIGDIKTLVLGNPAGRDEEVIESLHQIGLIFNASIFQKSTIKQLLANVDEPDEKYDLIIIFDEESYNGFNIAQAIWDNGLSDKYRILMISSNDQSGNYLRSIRLGIDSYLSKPFDINALEMALKDCFPTIVSDNINSIIENSGINVLIVEDNKMNQEVLGSLLTRMGCKYDVANDGKEGYMKAMQTKYDIIFMDLIMPVMNGFESSRMILKNDKNAFIVAMTADSMPDVKYKAESAGIKTFIPKSIKKEDIETLFVKYNLTSKKKREGF